MEPTNANAVQGTFFNTIHISGDILERAKANAVTQEEIITLIYGKYRKLTPWQVHSRYAGFCTNELGMKFKRTPPITSIRRAINTLTNGGVLKKLPEGIEGNEGMVNHYWEKLT